MSLPMFYTNTVPADAGDIVLNEDSSKHIVQVLRKERGDKIRLTDGRGLLLDTEISDAHKKHCTVSIISSQNIPTPQAGVTVAISLVKNNSRFEWLLEKLTEIGITEIIPLLCERTEKQHFRTERMRGILISAMLQSQQAWLPQLQEPVPFNTVVNTAGQERKYIAHCVEENRHPLNHEKPAAAASIILVGPEGDFTPGEISMAIAKQFLPVSLGETRLRTETAGLVAAVLLQYHLLATV